MARFADLGKHQGIAEIQQEGARGKFIDRFRNNARGEQVRKVKPEPLPSADKAPQRVTAYGAPRYFEPRDPVLLLSLPGTLHNATSRRVFHPKGLTTVRTKEDIEKFITPEARTSSFSSNRLWMPQEIDLLYDEFRLVGFFQKLVEAFMDIFMELNYTRDLIRFLAHRVRTHHGNKHGFLCWSMLNLNSIPSQNIGT